MYDPISSTIKVVGTVADVNMATAIAASDGSILVLSGGDVYRWTRPDTFVRLGRQPHPRNGAAAVHVAPNQTIVLGGSNAEVDSIDEITGEWSPLKPLPPPTRSGASLISIRSGSLLVVGGQTTEWAIADANLYDPAHDRWYPVSPLPVPRFVSAAVALDDGAIFVGGFSTGGTTLATATRYTPQCAAAPCEEDGDCLSLVCQPDKTCAAPAADAGGCGGDTGVEPDGGDAGGADETTAVGPQGGASRSSSFYSCATSAPSQGPSALGAAWAALCATMCAMRRRVGRSGTAGDHDGDAPRRPR